MRSGQSVEYDASTRYTAINQSGHISSRRISTPIPRAPGGAAAGDRSRRCPQRGRTDPPLPPPEGEGGRSELEHGLRALDTHTPNYFMIIYPPCSPAYRTGAVPRLSARTPSPRCRGAAAAVAPLLSAGAEGPARPSPVAEPLPHWQAVHHLCPPPRRRKTARQGCQTPPQAALPLHLVLLTLHPVMRLFPPRRRGPAGCPRRWCCSGR